MLVPAMAFAWWLVSLPVRQPHDVVAAPSSDESAEVGPQERADNEDGRETPKEPTAVDPAEATGERVVLKGPISPEIVRLAYSFLDLPMGAERILEVAGRRYAFVLEWHYHPLDHVGGPRGWHKGVTVYGVR